MPNRGRIMKSNADKTREQLIRELEEMTRRIAELEQKEQNSGKPGEVEREEETNFKEIFQTVSDGIIFADLKGTIIDANPALYRIIDMPRSELVGRNAVFLAKKMLSGSSLK